MQYFYASFMRGLEIQTDNASVERGGRKQKNKQKKKKNTCIITNCLVKCLLCNLLCACVVRGQFSFPSESQSSSFLMVLLFGEQNN